jgi:chorismate mutase/prephenate dehydratase
VTQAGDPAQAAIASRICADLYNLDILADSVADDTGNHTRFLCIGRDLEVHPDPNRVSLILSLPHKPGALSGLMSRLAAQEINLTKLESRPVPGADFQFRFHLDMEADIRTSAVISLLGELEQSAERFQFLGGYREV